MKDSGEIFIIIIIAVIIIVIVFLSARVIQQSPEEFYAFRGGNQKTLGCSNVDRNVRPTKSIHDEIVNILSYAIFHGTQSFQSLTQNRQLDARNYAHRILCRFCVSGYLETDDNNINLTDYLDGDGKDILSVFYIHGPINSNNIRGKVLNDNFDASKGMSIGVATSINATNINDFTDSDITIIVFIPDASKGGTGVPTSPFVPTSFIPTCSDEDRNLRPTKLMHDTILDFIKDESRLPIYRGTPQIRQLTARNYAHRILCRLCASSLPLPLTINLDDLHYIDYLNKDPSFALRNYIIGDNEKDEIESVIIFRGKLNTYNRILWEYVNNDLRSSEINKSIGIATSINAKDISDFKGNVLTGNALTVVVIVTDTPAVKSQ